MVKYGGHYRLAQGRFRMSLATCHQTDSGTAYCPCMLKYHWETPLPDSLADGTDGLLERLSSVLMLRVHVVRNRGALFGSSRTAAKAPLLCRI